MENKKTAEKRKETISSYILSKGYASVDDLINMTKVSRMTVLRDLNELEELKIIRKMRNGASAQPSSLFESDWAYREFKNMDDKASMCKLAYSLIEDGTSLFLSDSTTLYPIIKLLKERTLTIITACLPIINEIISLGYKGIDLIVIGGNYDSKYRSNYGKICIDAIEKIHPDLSIMSSAAYNQGEVFQSEECILMVKRAMLDYSKKNMVLLDHSKFEQTALFQLAKIDEFDFVIVDSHTTDDQIKDLKSRGAHVYKAKA